MDPLGPEFPIIYRECLFAHSLFWMDSWFSTAMSGGEVIGLRWWCGSFLNVNVECFGRCIFNSTILWRVVCRGQLAEEPRFFYGEWDVTPAVYDGTQWSTKPCQSFGIALQHHKNSNAYWFDFGQSNKNYSKVGQQWIARFYTSLCAQHLVIREILLCHAD